MADFVDKKGRTISIQVVGDIVYAHHRSKKVGDVLTTGPREVDDQVPPWPPKITGWDVDESFRRAGICEEMVRSFSRSMA
jgi:hypothetical protein